MVYTVRMALNLFAQIRRLLQHGYSTACCGELFGASSQLYSSIDLTAGNRRHDAEEAMGLMATAIGKEAISPMVPDIMQAALKVKAL